MSWRARIFWMAFGAALVTWPVVMWPVFLVFVAVRFVFWVGLTFLEWAGATETRYQQEQAAAKAVLS